jgi:hypothetical protein
LDPPFHGVRDNGLFILPDSAKILPELLPKNVRKAAFIGSLPLHSKFGLDQGFDIYNDDFGARGDRRRPPEKRAEAVFQSAAEWLQGEESGKRPFVFAHVFDPHYPYEAPPPWPQVAATLPGAGLYEGEVAYTDSQLGRLLRSVGAGGADRRATILLTADHGESLGAHREITHSIFVYDATQRVPLILAGPGIEPRLEINQRRLVDVAPTLLSRYGVDPAPGQTGGSLLEPSRVPEAYIETKEPELLRGGSPLHGIRTTEWKYIRAPRPELYNLVQDPGEKRNLYGTRPEIEARLSSQVEAILARSTVSLPLNFDPTVTAQLQALGYIATIEPGSTPDLGKDPKDGIDGAVALFHGAQAYLEGRMRAAEQLLLRAIQLDPEGKEAYSYLSGAYYSLGRYELSIDYARRALELPPHVNEGAIYTTLGEAFLALDRPEDALLHLNAALRLQPNNPDLIQLIQKAKRGAP